MARQSLSAFNPYAHQGSKSCLFNQALQTWKESELMSISHSERAARVTLDFKKAAVFQWARLKTVMWHVGARELTEEEEEVFPRGAGRGGGTNEMQISPSFFKETLTAEARLWQGEAVSPTSPNKHLSVSPTQTKGAPAPRCGTFCRLAAGDSMPFVKMRISCHGETLHKHARWTSVFEHLVKQYPHRRLITRTHKHTPWLDH